MGKNAQKYTDFYHLTQNSVLSSYTEITYQCTIDDFSCEEAAF